MLSRSEYIVEQKGWRTAFWLLLPAVLLGLTFQVLFSDNRVSERVEVAAKNLGVHYQVEFSRASLSLSDGLLPDLAILIEDVKILSEKPGERGILSIDEMRLPITLSSLFSNAPTIGKIEIGHAELVWLEKFWPGQKSEPANGAGQGLVTGQASQPPPEAKMTSSRTSLQEIQARSLRLQFPNLASELGGIQLRNLRMTLLDQPGLYAQYLVPGFVLRSDSPLTGQLSVQLDVRSLEVVAAQLSCNWRESQGLVAIKRNENQLAYDFRVASLPLVPLAIVAGRFGWEGLAREPLAHQVWLNGNGKGTWQTNQPFADSQLTIERLEIDGDWGRIFTENVAFRRLRPLQPQTSFTVMIDQILFEPLSAKLLRLSKPPFLGDYGILRGQLSVSTQGEMEFQGETTGTSLAFSNLGKRETQVISMARVTARQESEKLELVFDRIRLLDGLMIGEIQWRQDLKQKVQEVRFAIEELSLGPRPTEALTQNGSLGMMSLQGSLLKKADSPHWAGELSGQIDASVIAGVTFKKMDYQFLVKSDGRLRMSVNSPELMILPETPVADFLKPTLRELSPVGALWFRSFRAELGGFPNGKVDWSMRTQFQDFGTATSSGSWNEQGELSGDLIMKAIGRTWGIQGTRKEPAFVEEVSK